MSIFNKKTGRISVLSLLAAIIFFAVQLGTSKAFTPNYNSSNLIDNGTLLNNTTMSAPAIEAFLQNVGSGLANYTDVEACDSTIAPYYTHCGQRILAAQIVYDAAQAYGINPRAILATMEKEQSLVTDPAPSASQINCAMGYNSCSGYVGFFTQVDNGTWIIRYNYEGAQRHATWLSWSPGSGYPCSSAHAGFYSNGLYPGNTVTFYDSGGTAETVTLANAATASLYCYTPYVGPYWVTGYSGSYNFVYYFQLWFGSTQASAPYAWAYEGQSSYQNSSMTQPFDREAGMISLTPGGKAYLQVSARNVGYQTWTQSVVHLGTSHPQDRCSVFANSSWLAAAPCQRVAIQESTVAPGDLGTFDFSITAPSTTGTYLEYFNPLAEGITWMNDPGLYFAIDVVQQQSSISGAVSSLSSGQSLSVGQYLLSPDGHSVFSLQNNGSLNLFVNYKNLWTSSTYSSNTGKLFMQSDGNLVLYTKDGKAIWDSQTSGNPGATLDIQTDGNAVIYSSTGQPLWWSGTNGYPDGLSYVSHSVEASYMFPLQTLQTANGSYHLIFQSDGNLVLYSKTRAIWAAGTNGKSAALVAMQGDGNLVIYDNNFKPLWASNTGGQGLSTLVMQDDGNLVIYNSAGRPTWDSQTNGVQ